MPNTQAWQGSVNRPDAIYVVKAGDSLSKIAQAFYKDPAQFHRIATANGLDASRVLQIGTKLKIPNGGSVDPQRSMTDPEAMGPPAPASRVNAPAAKVVPGFTALSLSDWRVWVGGGLLLAAAYLMLRNSRR